MVAAQKHLIDHSPQIVIRDRWVPDPVAQALRLPVKSHLGRAVREIIRHVRPEGMDAVAELIERLSQCVVIESRLCLVGCQWSEKTGRREWVDYGLVREKVVSTAGVNFIVDAFQNAVEVENLKFHALGTGTNAEAAGDTALQTELTTQYNPNNTRATGSLTEGASANIFRTVGTNTVDSAAAVTEHGILSDVDVGEGTLLDRSVFSVINLANGDSLQSTYDFTVNSGG